MRFYDRPHRFYAGIDLHARTMHLCRADCAVRNPGVFPHRRGPFGKPSPKEPAFSGPSPALFAVFLDFSTTPLLTRGCLAMYAPCGYYHI